MGSLGHSSKFSERPLRYSLWSARGWNAAPRGRLKSSSGGARVSAQGLAHKWPCGRLSRTCIGGLRPFPASVPTAACGVISVRKRESSGYMPRRLNVYQTSQGFHDLAIAAPSMKAALEAWGASRDLFRRGFAKQSNDKEVIAAAMAQPGVVLRRPVGSNKRFQEHAELPTAESLSEHFKRTEVPRRKTTAPKSKRPDERKERDAAKEVEREAATKAGEKAERKVAAAFEKEERRRKLRRQKKEAAAARARARRRTMIEEAKSALDNARRDHTERTAIIEKDRAPIEKRAKEEEVRWQKLESRLEAALQKASR